MPVVSAPFRSAVRPVRRTQAQEDLTIAWEAIQAAGWYVQQLDSPIVRYDVWAHALTGAVEVLEHSTTRLQTWKGPYSPVASAELRGLRDVLIGWQAHAAASLQELDFRQALAAIYQSGLIVYAWAVTFGMEL